MKHFTIAPRAHESDDIGNPFLLPRLSRRIFAGTAAAAFSVLAASAARAEDVAICVGVNHYPKLRQGANLDGCVNDAHLFARKLEQFGFHNPIVLGDADATKANILGKIMAAKARLHSGDRFVLFFAGHGTLSSKGESVILPSDSEDASESHDIQVQDIYSAVKGLGDDVHKTVVLDSCHSGGMIRGIAGLRGFHTLRPRFYVRTAELNKPALGHRDVKKWQEVSVNGGDDLSNVVHDDKTASANSGICYFTAAQKNQVANETKVGGEEHGLFTYYLVNALKAPGDVWGKVDSDVSKKVAGDTSQEQTPLLYPSAEMDKTVFGGGAPATPQPPLTMEGVYNLSNPDPSVVTLKRYSEGPDPELSPVPVGSKNHFEVTVGQDGYLVVIGRDPKDALDVLFPRSANFEAVAVHKGDTIRIPSDLKKALAADEPGTDGVKAVLFASEEKARDFLRPFKGTGNNGLSMQAASRAWREVTKDDDTSGSVRFHTSEITTLIVPVDNAL